MPFCNLGFKTKVLPYIITYTVLYEGGVVFVFLFYHELIVTWFSVAALADAAICERGKFRRGKKSAQNTTLLIIRTLDEDVTVDL